MKTVLGVSYEEKNICISRSYILRNGIEFHCLWKVFIERMKGGKGTEYPTNLDTLQYDETKWCNY